MPFEELGSYEIVKEWGRSPVGRILLARDRETDRDVTIQLFDTLAHLPADEREAAGQRVLAACSPLVGLEACEIASVLDVDESEGLTYVVTERVEGTPFSVYCEPRSLLPEAEVLELGAAAARGLEAVHRAGAVHGAVHPGALLRVGASVKVVGFGLSAAPLAEGEPAPYLSPEQVRRQPLDARSDVFSLAAVLYEMLTGHRAFPGTSASTVLFRIVNEPARDARELVPALHEATAGLLARALAKPPDDRFPDAEALARALEDAAIVAGVDASLGAALPAPTGIAAPTPAGRVPARPTPRRTRRRPFVLGALLVALLAAGGFALLHRVGGPDPRDTAPLLQTRVRSEPPGLPLFLDGEPVFPGPDGSLRFTAGDPPPVLSASLACRTAERALSPDVAGGEIVLVLEPLQAEVLVESAVPGAGIRLNGHPAGALPVPLTLDLCRANRIELTAPGHRSAALDLPAGATPLEARTGVLALVLEPLPRGRLVLPRPDGLQLDYEVDGERVGRAVREIELDEGTHVLRFKNDFQWLDQRAEVHIVGGQTTTPEVAPRFGTLAVQAFPSNCKVFLRRAGQPWRYLDDTPSERRVATGSYEVKVQLIPTGDERIETVEIGEGTNPPLRVSFGGGS
jgi:hypothetical protein